MTHVSYKRINAAVFCVAAILSIAPAAFGKAQSGPPVDKAVRWASADGSVEVVLAPVVNTKTKTNYRLIVISAKPIQVAYHTSRNSSVKIDRTLAPVAPVLRDVRIYEFGHSFSRTTIWLGLTFERDGKRSNELTRVFYDSIEQTVPASSFKL